LAGYENIQTQQNRWQVTSVSGEGLEGQVAVGVPKAKVELQARIDKALAELKPEITALAIKYGFPADKPVALTVAGAQPQHLAAASGASAASLPSKGGFIKTAGKAESWTVAQAEPDLAYGKTTFNNTCSHCHGSNGFSPISERDLRRLKSRYKENWQESALQIIQNGRNDMGMPAWKETFKENEIKSIIAFLATIQK